MSGGRVEPLNISQDVILSSLVTYLRAQGGRDPDFINKLPTGYCCGFATLAAYGQWLEWQPKRIDETTHQPIPRDDWTWFQSVLTILARWDGQSKLSKLDKQDIERLLSLVEYFQHIDDYLPIGQGDWHEGLIDTRNRQPTKEYSVAGLFTAENLLAVLPDLVHEDHMILITSHNHAVSLLKHEGHYYFYDANSPDGVHVCPAQDVSDVSVLVNRLFSVMYFDQKTPSLLGFRMFNFDGQPATYPPHEALLKQVKDQQPSPGYADNTTVLHMAARIGSVESTSIYVEHVPQGGINLLDRNGATPAFIAAYNGHADVLRVLAEFGADLNKAMPSGETPAVIAALRGHVDVLHVLAKFGADLNQAGLDGITPAFIAAYNGHAKALSVLAANGADLDKAGPGGATPAFVAAQNGHAKALSVLATNGANLNQAGPDGATPAFIAAYNGHAKALSVLAANGADLDKARPDGATPAFIAAQNGHAEALSVLAANGVNLNQAGPGGATPAFIAAQNGYVDVLRVLAANGVNLNQAGPDGRTPAFVAAYNDHADAVNFIRSIINQRDYFLSQLDVISRRLSAEEIKLVHELRGKITKEWGLCDHNTWADEIRTLQTKIEGGRKLIRKRPAESGGSAALPGEGRTCSKP